MPASDNPAVVLRFVTEDLLLRRVIQRHMTPLLKEDHIIEVRSGSFVYLFCGQVSRVGFCDRRAYCQ